MTNVTDELFPGGDFPYQEFSKQLIRVPDVLLNYLIENQHKFSQLYGRTFESAYHYIMSVRISSFASTLATPLSRKEFIHGGVDVESTFNRIVSKDLQPYTTEHGSRHSVFDFQAAKAWLYTGNFYSLDKIARDTPFYDLPDSVSYGLVEHYREEVLAYVATMIGYTPAFLNPGLEKSLLEKACADYAIDIHAGLNTTQMRRITEEAKEAALKYAADANLHVSSNGAYDF